MILLIFTQIDLWHEAIKCNFIVELLSMFDISVVLIYVNIQKVVT